MSPRAVGPTSLMEAPPRPRGKAPATALPSFDIAIRSETSRVEVARRVASAWMRHRCGMPTDQVDDLLLVVSELCTNAVLHGRHESIDVRGWMPSQDAVRLEVHDKSPSAVPTPQRVAPESESGRGLFLVDLLIEELGGKWGFSEDGTVAWCDVPIRVERMAASLLTTADVRAPGSCR